MRAKTTTFLAFVIFTLTLTSAFMAPASTASDAPVVARVQNILPYEMATPIDSGAPLTLSINLLPRLHVPVAFNFDEAFMIEHGNPTYLGDMKEIAACESHMNPNAVGDGGNSLGMFQLWSGWFQPDEDPFDPWVNLHVALRVREIRGRFGGSGGWTCANILGIM